MKLPSINYLRKEAFNSVQRFPLVLFCALAGTFSAIYLIEIDKKDVDSMAYFIKAIITSSLGLSFLLATTLFIERKLQNQGKKWLLQLAAVLLLAVYFISLPNQEDQLEGIHLIRFFLLNLGAHLLVAFAPFIGTKEVNGFWQFNKALFLRMSTSIIFSAVLFGGLALAILATDKLLGFHVEINRYFQLWIFIVGIFNTWFFLSGIPKDFSEIEKEEDYPKPLKIFSQYILIPIVTIYLIILYAYAFKIIIAFKWPNGWVAHPILWYSVTGILSFLLTFPLQQRDTKDWVKIFSRWFFVASIPLVVLLLLSIWQRVSDYGITENRYFAIVLALWLAAISIYFAISKRKNIKIIPVTLCMIAFISSYGPLSTFHISKLSQVSRLEKILSNNKILVEGKIQKVQDTIPANDKEQIHDILRYLTNIHGISPIQHWFDEDLDSITIDMGRYNKSNAIMKLMGITDYAVSSFKYFDYTAEEDETVDISDHDYLFRIEAYLSRKSDAVSYEQEFTIYNEKFEIRIDQTLQIERNKKVIVEIDLITFAKELSKEFKQKSETLPRSRLMLEAASKDISIKIYFDEIQLSLNNDVVEIGSLKAVVLLKLP